MCAVWVSEMCAVWVCEMCVVWVSEMCVVWVCKMCMTNVFEGQLDVPLLRELSFLRKEKTRTSDSALSTLAILWFSSLRIEYQQEKNLSCYTWGHTLGYLESRDCLILIRDLWKTREKVVIVLLQYRLWQLSHRNVQFAPLSKMSKSDILM